MILPLILAVAALQAPQDDERTKRILERIEKEIRASEERLREDIRAILRAELSGGKAPSPLPANPPPPPPPPAVKRRVLLGITADEMTDAERRKLGIGGGIKVAEVRGPAAAAGIKSGDVIVSMDGKPVTEETIGALLEQKQPGDPLAVEVARGTERVKLTVVLGERKE
jgi:membrane-associated protease RseP (regulator of RpoE activity)